MLFKGGREPEHKETGVNIGDTGLEVMSMNKLGQFFFAP